MITIGLIDVGLIDVGLIDVVVGGGVGAKTIEPMQSFIVQCYS